MELMIAALMVVEASITSQEEEGRMGKEMALPEGRYGQRQHLPWKNICKSIFPMTPVDWSIGRYVGMD